MKNVLITGGAGFIGSHLTAKLLQEKDINIIAIDNFITSDFYNIEEFVRNPRFEFIKADLINPLEMETFNELAKFKIKIYGIEEIYHLACPTSPKDYDKLPLETCLANSHATKNALDIASKYKSSFLFVSSGAVYGSVSEENQPVKETAWGHVETLGPRACYIDGKRFAENLTVYYGSEHNFSTKTVRVFNTYGPKMRLNDGRIIPDFVAASLDNKNIIIHGGKQSSGTFCYIDDIIDGLLKMMISAESGPINLGSDQLYTLESIARAIIEITQSTATIVFKDAYPYRDPEPAPDISLAKQKLDWIPVTTLEEGLIKTVKAMGAEQIVKFEG